MKGSDSLSRYIAIIALANLSFSLLSSVFIHSPLFTLLLALPATYIIAMTTVRRLNDANANMKWPLLNSLLFLLAGLTIATIQEPVLYWLLVPNIAVSLALANQKSAGNKHYILGYNGPVVLQTKEKVQTNRGSRIEPTLAGNANVELSAESSIEAQNTTAYAQVNEEQSFSQQNDNSSSTFQANNAQAGNSLLLTEIIQQYKRHLAIGLTVFVALLLMAKVLLNNTPSEESTITEPVAVAEIEDERLYELAMPDDFLLSLSEEDGLFIEWQISASDPVSLWSLKTANGDSSCKEITFNNGDKVRSLSVAIEDDTLQYARFSPLDTEFIVRSLAKRGSFTLCGYKFSLKGSQATIGKHAKYSDFMTYSG